jgi:tripartite-type tricarboxylate transporter receptor subunit TctC
LPDAVAKKLEAVTKKAIEDPTVVQKMQELGLQASYLSGADYEQVLRSTRKKTCRNSYAGS